MKYKTCQSQGKIDIFEHIKIKMLIYQHCEKTSHKLGKDFATQLIKEQYPEYIKNPLQIIEEKEQETWTHTSLTKDGIQVTNKHNDLSYAVGSKVN